MAARGGAEGVAGDGAGGCAWRQVGGHGGCTPESNDAVVSKATSLLLLRPEAAWVTVAKRLVLDLEKAEPTLVFIFDELPAMLDTIRRRHGAEAGREFMAWFRSVRLQQKDRLRRHRFLAGGSTGIDLILRRLDAPDKLNDFERLYVEPVHRAVAVELTPAPTNTSSWWA